MTRRGGLGLDKARGVQSETGHRRHLARASQQLHLADAEVAQDLCADAIGAQVHARLTRELFAGVTRSLILEFCEQPVGRLGTVEQNQHAGR